MCSFLFFHVRSEEKNELHNYYNPLRYSTYMFGRIAAPVQTKCPNIYVRLSKRNVHVVWTRACVRVLLLTRTSAELPGLPSLRSSICRWEPANLNA